MYHQANFGGVDLHNLVVAFLRTKCEFPPALHAAQRTEAPVAWLEIAIVAFGITAPDGSVTVPAMFPNVDCPCKSTTVIPAAIVKEAINVVILNEIFLTAPLLIERD
jgi:hypothetical protein